MDWIQNKFTEFIKGWVPPKMKIRLLWYHLIAIFATSARGGERLGLETGYLIEKTIFLRVLAIHGTCPPQIWLGCRKTPRACKWLMAIVHVKGSCMDKLFMFCRISPLQISRSCKISLVFSFSFLRTIYNTSISSLPENSFRFITKLEFLYYYFPALFDKFSGILISTGY